MASQAGEKHDPGGARQGMLSNLQSRDLPSKRLLGKGLAGIGYETQLGEVRYARKDFVGVAHDIFRNEANVLIGLKDHQNVVKTHGMTFDKLSCSLVLEYMDDTVSGLLQKRKDQRRKRTPAGTGSGNQSELSRTLSFEMPEALYLMLQIARGMEYLHEQDISHGDLKTRNILVSYRNDSELSVKAVKVADFGLVRTKRKSMSYVSDQALLLDMVRWKAPECLDMPLLEATSPVLDSKYSDKGLLGVTHSADVYSFAVTCFQILTGEEPYRKRNWEELVVDIVSDKLRPTLPASCPQVLRDLLVSCWGENPRQRPTFSDICKKLERMLTVIICYELQWIIKEHREQWEKDLVSDSNSWRPLESGEPISQVSEALKIIEDATEASISFVMNKHQCTSLASRLKAIGEKLKESAKESVGSKSLVPGNKVEFRACDVLLTVLRTAKALLSEYRESQERIPSVLPQTESRKKFKEIHAELDLLNSLFRFEDFGSTGSETERSAILTGDADEDLKEMFESLYRLAHGDASRQAAFLTILKVVVSEKSKGLITSNDLLRNLIIEPASVETEGEVCFLEKMGASSGSEYVTALAPEISNSGASSRSEYVTALAPEISNSVPPIRGKSCTDEGFAHSERTSQTIQRGRRRRRRPGDLAPAHLARREKSVCEASIRVNSLTDEVSKRKWETILRGRRQSRRRRDEERVRQWPIRGNSITDKSLAHTKKYMSQPNMKRKSFMLSEGERKSVALVESRKWTEQVMQSKSHWSQLEEQIERSKVHWSRLSAADEDDEVAEVSNVEAFKALQSHPTWGTFFRTFGYDLGIRGSSGELVVGQKFELGGQAGLYDVQIKWADPKMNEEDLRNGTQWALKVFYAEGTSWRRHLQSQVPRVYVQWHVERSERLKLGMPPLKRCVVNILCGTLLTDGQFAFVMEKEQTDLRNVIDRNLKLKSVHEGGPFPKGVAEEIMYDVALGLDWLHERDIVHRDLKASNVLVNEVKDGHYECFVSDFEASVGVVGTGFFRAPEILHAMRERKLFEKPKVFSKAADVYSYGMTCYEILTGNVPFETHPRRDYDLVLGGNRPILPNYVDDWTCDILSRCWQSDPAARPSTGEILNLLSTTSAAIRKRSAAEQLSDLADVKDNVVEASRRSLVSMESIGMSTTAF